MADSKRGTPRKSEGPTPDSVKPGAGKRATGNTGSKPKKRRLGRGLGSLLSVPVEVDSGAPVAQPKAAVPAPATPKKGLGAVVDTVRGLVSEPSQGGIPEGPVGTGAESAEGTEEGGAPRVQLVQVDQIQANRYQPRTDFDEGALKELADSIERSGLMQPVVVRSTGNSDGMQWELVAGERRFRAIKLLGRSVLPAVIIEADDREAAELALIENLQREDLNPLDRASALANLRDTFGLSQADLAERVGLDRSTVANLLRILELDDFCAAAVRRGTLSLGHAKALLAVSDAVLRRTTAAAAVNAGWSVRELERRIRHLDTEKSLDGGGAQKSQITTKQANVVDLERRLGEILGMCVNISLVRKKGSGKLQVEFNSLEQFDTLTDLLGLGPGEPT